MLVVEIQEKNEVGKSLENSEVNIYTYINILLISAPVGHIFLVIAIIVISGNGFAKLVVNMVNKKLETKVS